MEEKSVRFPSLNGLRAISICFVLFHHLSMRDKIFQNIGEHKFAQLFIKFITDGQLGVNIFFVISGFLITSLLLIEENRNGAISIKDFYIRRTLRIFPAYYFFLFVLFVLQLVHIVQIGCASWFTALTYTKYFNWGADWFTAHAWSLSIEEQFYLFWPLLFAVGDKTRKNTAFFLVLIVPIIKLYLYFHPVIWINDLTLFKRIDAIAIGCLIALYKNLLLERLRPYFKVIFYVSLLGICFLICLPAINDKLHLHLGLLIILFGSTFGTIANIFIGAILLYSVWGNRGLWFRLLNTQILNYIGMLSYSIYLWQQLFISDLGYWANSFPQNVICIFMVAVFSYYCIEQPFLKLKTKFQKT
ncbi:MAG TPA: acyltransferase [Arachidicoccus sp.]